MTPSVAPGSIARRGETGNPCGGIVAVADSFSITGAPQLYYSRGNSITGMDGKRTR